MMIKEQEEVLTAKVKTTEYNLILYNDDVNTFDHVIDCLIAICNHTLEQAEQCTYLVHYKGKYSVKVGAIEKLRPMMIALNEQGLSAKIK